ncbi:unnamed protein product, partial [Ectocarpus sp. 13 AM-2016]
MQMRFLHPGRDLRQRFHRHQNYILQRQHLLLGVLPPGGAGAGAGGGPGVVGEPFPKRISIVDPSHGKHGCLGRGRLCDFEQAGHPEAPGVRVLDDKRGERPCGPGLDAGRPGPNKPRSRRRHHARHGRHRALAHRK